MTCQWRCPGGHQITSPAQHRRCWWLSGLRFSSPARRCLAADHGQMPRRVAFTLGLALRGGLFDLAEIILSQLGDKFSTEQRFSRASILLSSVLSGMSKRSTSRAGGMPSGIGIKATWARLGPRSGLASLRTSSSQPSGGSETMKGGNFPGVVCRMSGGQRNLWASTAIRTRHG